MWEEEEKQQLKQVLLRVRLDELASIQLASYSVRINPSLGVVFLLLGVLLLTRRLFVTRTEHETSGSLEEDAAAVLVSLGVIELVIRLVGGREGA